MSKFEAIIIDPDIQSRMRLKQATASVHDFGKVYQLSTLKEGLDKINGKEKFDVIFISFKIEQAEMGPFIKAGKETPGGQDSAYVLVLPPKDQDSSTVAANVLVGADGFLFEPYSVDYLLEITKLAAKVKKERSDTREKAAIGFLVNDVMSQVDRIAYEKAFGRDIAPSIKRLKETSESFKNFTEESRNLYYSLLTEALINAPVPKKVFVKYGGVSSRVKKKMDAKKAADAAAAGPTPTDSNGGTGGTPPTA